MGRHTEVDPVRGADTYIPAFCRVLAGGKKGSDINYNNKKHQKSSPSPSKISESNAFAFFDCFKDDSSNDQQGNLTYSNSWRKQTAFSMKKEHQQRESSNPREKMFLLPWYCFEQPLDRFCFLDASLRKDSLRVSVLSLYC